TVDNKIHRRGPFVAVELPAAATIQPGMLLEETSAGKLQPHSTQAGFAEVIVAQEAALQGRTKDDAYSADEPVNAYIYQRGVLGLALLKAGTNYTRGLKLQSAGDGTLEGVGGTEKQVIAQVVEPIDLSASAAVDTLSLVRYF